MTSRDFKNRLYDDQRELPTYSSVLPEVVEFLKKDAALGLIYINGKELRCLEEKFGGHIFDEILIKISRLLTNMKGTIIRRNDIVSLNRVKGYSFIIFMGETRSDRRGSYLCKENVEKTCDRIQTYLHANLFHELFQYTGATPKVNVGYSFAVYNPIVDPWRAVYCLIEEAREIAELQMSQIQLRNRGRIQKILLEEDVSSYYQPIVRLSDLSIEAYESLSRGPKNTELEAPIILFNLAEETGMVYEVDRLCRRRAIINAKNKKPGTKLFLNALPNLIYNPDIEAADFVKFIESHGVSPQEVVFEITERHAVERYAHFRQALRFYSDLGIQFAIDDVGAGYSSLEAIMEINPRYVKIDASIIRGASENSSKQEMLKALKMMSDSIDALTIAEGIETDQDLEMVKDLGIDFGQGYLFARPEKHFVTTFAYTHPQFLLRPATA